MTILLMSVASVFAAVATGALIRVLLLQKRVTSRQAELAAVTQRANEAQQYYQSETARIYSEAQEGVRESQRHIDQQMADLGLELERVREHYEAESRRMHTSAAEVLSKLQKDVERLSKYEGIRDASAEAQRVLADALNEATSLQSEAQALLQQSRTAVR
jgi:ribosome-associated translation inhibitor RaiA